MGPISAYAPVRSLDSRYLAIWQSQLNTQSKLLKNTFLLFISSICAIVIQQEI